MSLRLLPLVRQPAISAAEEAGGVNRLVTDPLLPDSVFCFCSRVCGCCTKRRLVAASWHDSVYCATQTLRVAPGISFARCQNFHHDFARTLSGGTWNRIGTTISPGAP